MEGHDAAGSLPSVTWAEASARVDVASSVSDCVFELLDLSEFHEIKASQASERRSSNPLNQFHIEGNQLRLSWVGEIGSLRAVLTLSDDSDATCGSRFPQRGNTVMTERLILGCAILVGARMGWHERRLHSWTVGMFSTWC